jgi:hypothetical protein
MTEPDLKLENDGKTVTITFTTPPPVTLKLDAPALEALLAKLGEFRAHVLPEVPRTFPEGQSFPSVGDPAWKTGPDFLHGFVFLDIRDPRFGWLRYILSRGDAGRLASSLQKDMEITPWVSGVE